ncbi:hypothetical protein GRX01_00185 [Halobaculum sp. WSA2]|uniref:Uncharacterized protein n=1 Tax=Halobaculum saliterrae TaxID=2073113 RepID=A0A6B0SUC5_9EURY|nr:hypothetical protein [Halobaculum saliterrae]MXR39782.1 hypothetical protein [Halobaculum saliterrae]
MTEGAADADRESPRATDAPVGVGVRVEPNAAVVSHDARVPPDPREETPVTFRPVAAARAIGGRLVRAIARRGGRSRRGRGN